eukprot:CAMPEP_0184479162 /NCGR_PEP_ID=MMETSP0113_2-20130426/993_1 /TAXON_ID=91329 /ORGANISM="Norrisiella sphaerica, Strain BC52" /LENGTH=205 /DNA_ID=CAMNT_0026857181 /DNA_START=609 /DNA_END=1226 /DNA_ORIENTATION=+
MVALLTASKVWEDNPTWNGQISQLFPAIPVRGLNRLECAFHSQLQYDLHISAKTYSRYYFALRALRINKKPTPQPQPVGTDLASPQSSDTKTKYYMKLSSSSNLAGGLVRRSASYLRLESEGKIEKAVKVGAAAGPRKAISIIENSPRKATTEEECEARHPQTKSDSFAIAKLEPTSTILVNPKDLPVIPDTIFRNVASHQAVQV